MIIIEEGWEYVIWVYILFLMIDILFERYNGVKVFFKYDIFIFFFKKI